MTKKITKCITIDFALADRKVLTQSIKLGIDVARLSFSHGDQKLHQQLIKKIRQLAKQKNKIIIIIEDVAGSEIRVSQIGKNKLELSDQEKVIVAASADLADINASSLAYKVLPVDLKAISESVKKSDRIFINNNSVVLIVEKVEDTLIYTKVVQSGKITTGNQVIISGQVNHFIIPERKILAALQLKPDYISLAVPKLTQLKKIKKLFKNSATKLLIKLEDVTQVKTITKLIKAADGLLIDRQRLGLEIPQSKFIIIEKDLIKVCQKMNKIVM